MDDAHFTRDSGEGFTLLELLLVITILGAVAWLSVESATDNMDQVRFDKTKRHIAAIKRALIGDSSRTLNGEPVISGYVADMGGVPEDLRALLMKEYCLEYPEAPNASVCNALGSGGTWVNQTAYNGTAILPHGWRGPYLPAESYTNASGDFRYVGFRDGWGTSNNNASTEYRNFGWNYTAYNSSTSSSKDIILVSYGRDGAPGKKFDELDADYPPDLGGTSQVLISQHRYKIPVQNVTVDFGYLSPANATAHKDVCLRIARKLYYPGSGSAGQYGVVDIGLLFNGTSLLQDAANNSYAFSVGNSTPANATAIKMVRQFSFTPTDIYMGEIAYSVAPYDNATATCNSTGLTWRTVKVLPEAGFPTLYWSL